MRLTLGSCHSSHQVLIIAQNMHPCQPPPPRKGRSSRPVSCPHQPHVSTGQDRSHQAWAPELSSRLSPTHRWPGRKRQDQVAKEAKNAPRHPAGRGGRDPNYEGWGGGVVRTPGNQVMTSAPIAGLGFSSYSSLPRLGLLLRPSPAPGGGGPGLTDGSRICCVHTYVCMCTYMCPACATHAACDHLRSNACHVYTPATCTGHSVYTVDTGPASPTSIHCVYSGPAWHASRTDVHSFTFAHSHPLQDPVTCVWMFADTDAACLHAC